MLSHNSCISHITYTSHNHDQFNMDAAPLRGRARDILGKSGRKRKRGPRSSLAILRRTCRLPKPPPVAAAGLSAADAAGLHSNAPSGNSHLQPSQSTFVANNTHSLSTPFNPSVVLGSFPVAPAITPHTLNNSLTVFSYNIRSLTRC